MALADLEIRRKVVHLAGGVVLSILIWRDLLDFKLLSILFIIGLMISVLSLWMRIPVIGWFLQQFDRQKNIRTFPGKGAVFMLLSAALVTLLFPNDIAAASMMILALGDAFGPLVGQFGSIRHPLNQMKVLEGTIAGIATATIGALYFVPWWKALVAASLAMTFETMEIEVNRRIIDDNITVPLIAGLALWLLR
jgi:dolichol kinase